MYIGVSEIVFIQGNAQMNTCFRTVSQFELAELKVHCGGDFQGRPGFKSFKGSDFVPAIHTNQWKLQKEMKL